MPVPGLRVGAGAAAVEQHAEGFLGLVDLQRAPSALAAPERAHEGREGVLGGAAHRQCSGFGSPAIIAARRAGLPGKSCSR